MKEVTETNFEELAIPRREVQNLSDVRYRVYSDWQNFELVEAPSALEALQRSSTKKAYKIERHNPLGDNVLQMGVVQELLGMQIGVAKEVVEIDPPVAEALSGEQVAQLLNNPAPGA